MTDLAIEAHALRKRFGARQALDGIDLAVTAGAIFGVLGPNGAGKTTLLRTLLGIIDPDEGRRRVLGADRPLGAAHRIGYLPEERGLYGGMIPREAIAFLGALRGLPLAAGRRRAEALLEQAGLSGVHRPIRTLSKGQAQTVQLLGTIVHEPDLLVLDEPFSGLDALNQGRLEGLIRAERGRGATVLFSTHVIAHAERLCEQVAIVADGQVRFLGSVDEARGRLRPVVRLATKEADGAWRQALPADARLEEDAWRFDLPVAGIEPLLAALISGGAGIERLSIERPGLHDAFISIVGHAGRRDEAEAA